MSHKCKQQNVLNEICLDLKKLLAFRNKMVGVYIALGFLAGVVTFFGTVITIFKYFDKEGRIAKMIYMGFSVN